MVLNRTGRPTRAAAGRRSFSDGGLFADNEGIVHIRVPHTRTVKGTRSYRATQISLWCEQGGFGSMDIKAIPDSLKPFPTCVRCLGAMHAV